MFIIFARKQSDIVDLKLIIIFHKTITIILFI